MTDLSTITEEQIVKIDKDTAVRYKVVEERIDLKALRREKESLEAELATKEPTKEELVMLGRAFHPYYMIDRQDVENKIKEIEKLLNSDG